MQKLDKLAALVTGTTAEVPKVGTYGELKGVKEYNPHHVPPKGLMKWIVRVLEDVPPAIWDQSSIFRDWKKNKAAASKEMVTGNNLTSILIHQNTHIKKTGDAEQNKYRAHHGSAVRDTIEKVMKEDRIQRTKGTRVASLTKMEQISLLKDILEESGEDTALATPENIPSYKARMQGALDKGGGRASTQFYMTELDAHSGKNDLKRIIKSGKVDGTLQDYKTDVEQGVKHTFGIARQQAQLAVKTALNGRLAQGKDGTAQQQNVALAKLKPHGRSTWYKFVDRFAQF